jgi:hypothetical protein
LTYAPDAVSHGIDVTNCVVFISAEMSIMS